MQNIRDAFVVAVVAIKSNLVRPTKQKLVKKSRGFSRGDGHLGKAGKSRKNSSTTTAPLTVHTQTRYTLVLIRSSFFCELLSSFFSNICADHKRRLPFRVVCSGSQCVRVLNCMDSSWIYNVSWRRNCEIERRKCCPSNVLLAPSVGVVYLLYNVYRVSFQYWIILFFENI